MDAKRKKVDKLLSDKWNIERKIENIQSECNHENKVLKQIKKLKTGAYQASYYFPRG